MAETRLKLVIDANTKGVTDAVKNIKQEFKGINGKGLEGANASFKKAQASASNLKTSLEQVSLSTNRARGTFASLGSTLSPTIKQLIGIGSAFAAITTAIKGVKSIASFQTSLAEISTITDDARVTTKEFSDELLNLASQFGTSGAEQARAFYQIISAGVTDAAKAQTLLIEANKLAVGGLTTVEGAIDVLTSTVNAFGQENLSAARASDVLFGTVRLGKTRVEDLQASLGQILPSAKAVGLTFEEVSGAIAQLTTRGISTSEAVTQVNAILTAVLKKQGQAKQFGETLSKSFSLENLREGGLVNFLEELNTNLGGSEEKLTKLFGRVEGSKAVLALGADGFAGLADKIAQLEGSAGAADAAFEKISKTISFQFSRSVSGITTSLTSVFLPVLEGIGTGLKALNDFFADISQEISNNFTPRLIQLSAVLAGYLVLVQGVTFASVQAAASQAILNTSLIAYSAGLRVAQVAQALFTTGTITLSNALKVLSSVSILAVVTAIVALAQEFIEIRKQVSGLDTAVAVFALKAVREFNRFSVGVNKALDFAFGKFTDFFANNAALAQDLFEEQDALVKKTLASELAQKENFAKADQEATKENEDKKAEIKVAAVQTTEERIAAIIKASNDGILAAQDALLSARLDGATNEEIAKLAAQLSADLSPKVDIARTKLQELFRETGDNQALQASKSLANGLLGIEKTLDKNTEKAKDFRTQLAELRVNSPDEIGLSAVQQTASGITTALNQVRNGTKEADEAFGDFAKNFLSRIADMIVQAAILQAIQGAFSVATGSADSSGASSLNTGLFSNTAAAGGLISGGKVVKRFAQGGQVTGPGTGTSDSVPAMLSNGEFVTDAKTVSFFGSEFFSKLKATARAGISFEPPSFSTLPRFAEGGFVGGPSSDFRTSEASPTAGSMSVELINTGSNSLRVERVEQNEDGGKLGIKIFVDDLKKNGPASQAMQSAFGLKRKGLK